MPSQHLMNEELDEHLQFLVDKLLANNLDESRKLKIVELLKKIPLFHSQPDSILGDIAKAVSFESFSAEECLIARDEVPDSIYFIVKGSVRVSREDMHRVEQTIRVLKAGECMGEIGMLAGLPRSADAITNERTDLMVITRDDLHKLIRLYPSLAFAFFRVFSQRLIEMNTLLAMG